MGLAKRKTLVAKVAKKKKVANFKFHKAIKEGKNALDRKSRHFVAFLAIFLHFYLLKLATFL